MTKQELRLRAAEIWIKHKQTGTVPNQAERSTMLDAYWSNALPKDPDYSVAQWVEDEFPAF